MTKDTLDTILAGLSSAKGSDPLVLMMAQAAIEEQDKGIDGGAIMFMDSLVVGPNQAIENQEKRGQESFNSKSVLPRDGSIEEEGWDKKEEELVTIVSPNKAILEAMGFVFHDIVDDVFVNVTMPNGWSKNPTDHVMWSPINDEKGRVRLKVFYKAAMYDQSARLHLQNALSVLTDHPVCGWGDGYTEEGAKQRVMCVEKYDGTTLWQSDTFPRYPWKEYAAEDWDAKYYDPKKKELDDWLSTNYPDYKNPLAYWDVL